MRKPLLLCIMLALHTLTLQAQTITAKQNGSWASPATWDLNRTPADNDIVVIPAGRTVNMINTPYPQNNFESRPSIRLRIYGTLDFSNPGNDKLYLDANSIIQVYAGGQIKTNSSSTEIISIFSGTNENIVWDGTPSIISGDVFATGTSSKFSFGLLPLKFISFSAALQKDGTVHLKWETAEERNTDLFYIESYNTSTARWETAGVVKAAGNAYTTQTYNYVVQEPGAGKKQYRIKEKDLDGSTYYSPVCVVQKKSNEGQQVWYNKSTGTVFINASTDVLKAVYIYDVKGRMVLQQKAFSASSINVSALTQGIYLINTFSVEGNKAQHKIYIN